MCLSPDPKFALVDTEGPANALRDLGCRVTSVDMELSSLDPRLLSRDKPDIICIDAGDNLPAAYRALGRIRLMAHLAHVPVLLVVTVSHLNALDFGAGADDFVLRPIIPAELYARVRQLDWRTSIFAADETVKVGPLVLDVAGYEAQILGRRLTLTQKEFELLKFLAQNQGRVFSRSQLMRSVWNHPGTERSRTVDIHVRRLRAKLGPAASLIVTVRNVGYKLVSPGKWEISRNPKNPARRKNKRGARA